MIVDLLIPIENCLKKEFLLQNTPVKLKIKDLCTKYAKYSEDNDHTLKLKWNSLPVSNSMDSNSSAILGLFGSHLLSATTQLPNYTSHTPDRKSLMSELQVRVSLTNRRYFVQHTAKSYRPKSRWPNHIAEWCRQSRSSNTGASCFFKSYHEISPLFSTN